MRCDYAYSFSNRSLEMAVIVQKFTFPQNLDHGWNAVENFQLLKNDLQTNILFKSITQ